MLLFPDRFLRTLSQAGLRDVFSPQCSKGSGTWPIVALAFGMMKIFISSTSIFTQCTTTVSLSPPA
jgi:hypothetical protein